MTERRPVGREAELTALVIAPDRELAQQFLSTLPETRSFQVLADLKTYPPQQTLDIRLRQLKPDVLLLDLASDLETACSLIGFVTSFRPPIHVIGLHRENASDAIVRSLRAGATEFLYSPFDISTQREAIGRIRRLRQPEVEAPKDFGKVVVFSSTKPGSGSSTLATQTAHAIKRMTSKRVLLVDFDLMGGTISFSLKLSHAYSVQDALQHSEHLDPALWAALVVNSAGVDILPAPETPSSDVVEHSRLHDVLEYARMLYDWVLIDLPVVFHRSSLMALTESDRAFLVSTSELPSLHLARRAVQMLLQLGFAKDRFQVVINRASRSDGIGSSDIEKLFNCTVHAMLPNDYFSLHRVVTLGETLSDECELGRAVQGLAGQLTGLSLGDKRRGAALMTARPVFSQT
ncbi:MAG: AAA family ATPase [Bryobacteraceae bacterium]|nr:AAA family ATPase [Bryobacteraceae bacterium]